MSANVLARRSDPAPVVALFDLTDAAERFMVGTMQRFHGEDRLYRAHDLRRATSATGDRLVLEVASFQPQRRGASEEWMLITWNIDEVSIRFEDCAGQRAAADRFAMA